MSSKNATFVQLGRQLGELQKEGLVQLIVDPAGNHIFLLSLRSSDAKKLKTQRIIDGYMEVVNEKGSSSVLE